jgi:hypothetical protein
MSALSRQHDASFLDRDWPPEVAQLLDEHHLAAFSDFAGRRLRFAVALGQFLGNLRETEVCTFYGKFITDLDSFCYQLERAVPGPLLDRRVDGPGGVADLLRTRVSIPGRPATKFRYYIWHDADVLLRADPVLFGQLVDSIAGVAAEAEYVSDDMLLIHRGVFVGSSELKAYAEDPKGQFQSWYDDGMGEPFWKIVTDIDAPPTRRYPIDILAL